MRVNKLMKLDREVTADMRIAPVHDIEKMKTEYKNKKACND